MEIPLVDLKANYYSIKGEIDKAINDTVINSHFILGRPVKDFEQAWSNYCEAKYSCGVANGTEALRLSLLAIGITSNDEVITVPNTFIATTECISACSGKIVFVDINKSSYNIDHCKIEEKITKKTKAIVAVDLYGNPCNIDELKKISQKYNLKLICDCAQSHGAKYKNQKTGSLGDISSFSMFPAKILGAFGDAGIITTNNKDVFDKIFLLRNHGRLTKYEHLEEAYNSRLDALQAAILLVKLKYLDKWVEKRRHLAQIYFNELNDMVICPTQEEWAYHSFYMYVIRAYNRDKLLDYLKKNNIMCGLHYPIPLHLQKAYTYLNHRKGDFPVTEQICKEIISIPLYPELTEIQQGYIISKIKEFYKK